MKSVRVGAVLALAVLLTAGTALATDLVTMPLGNRAPVLGGEADAIYVDADGTSVVFLEGYYQVTPAIEVGVIHVEPEAGDSQTEISAAYTVLPESMVNPAVIVGAYNLTGSDWGASDEIAPYVMAAKTLRLPKLGPPSTADPLIRAHLGYGTEYHGDTLFGAVQALLAPNIGAIVLSYQEEFGAAATYIVKPGIEVSAGVFAENPFLRVGVQFPFAK